MSRPSPSTTPTAATLSTSTCATGWSTPFDELEASDEVRAVVVTGAPPAFCAGADLSHLGDAAEEGLRAVYEGFLRVGRSPLPDHRRGQRPRRRRRYESGAGLRPPPGRRSARSFDTRFLQLGIHPGGGHTWMFRRIAGPEATMATVLFGEVLDGAEAERAGLVWRCVDDDQLLPVARQLAGRAAAAPPSWPDGSRPPSTTWPASNATRTRSTASWSTKCGRWASPPSPNCSPRSRHASVRAAERGRPTTPGRVRWFSPTGFPA